MFMFRHDGQGPLYVQLSKQIREQVLTGALAAGARLPSVRGLARELAVSRNTVENAYLDLAAEGYIRPRPRSGYFVADLARETLSPPPPSWGPEPGEPERAQEAFAYDFHPARLDPASFPVRLWRGHLAACLREQAERMTVYGDPHGEWELRREIRDYLHRSRGVRCGVRQVLACSGLQEALSVLAVLLRAARPKVAVEDPGYFLPRSVLRNQGFEVLAAPIGPDGIDLEALRASGADVAYVTPSHQFPLGLVMPVGHRLKLLDWAAREGRFIIEDDYDSELRYQGKPIPSLQGLCPEGNVVYMGSFSKVLSPALRIGYMVLPPALLEVHERLFRDYQPPVSLLEQLALARFMGEGDWDRHVRRMRAACARKHQAMVRAVGESFGDRASIIGQGAGLHVAVRVRGLGLGERGLLQKARAQGIRLFPFSATRADGREDQGMLLLGFGAMDPERISRGVRLLAGTCLD